MRVRPDEINCLRLQKFLYILLRHETLVTGNARCIHLNECAHASKFIDLLRIFPKFHEALRMCHNRMKPEALHRFHAPADPSPVIIGIVLDEQIIRAVHGSQDALVECLFHIPEEHHFIPRVNPDIQPVLFTKFLNFRGQSLNGGWSGTVPVFLIMRSGNHVCDAFFRRDFQHFKRRFHRLRSVVNSRQNMAMHVYHKLTQANLTSLPVCPEYRRYP